MNKNTIESKAAGALFERTKVVSVGGKAYSVARPTLATLFLVSEIASTMPETGDPKAEQALQWTVRRGRHYRNIAKMVAVLMLGAKEAERSNKRSFLCRLFRKSKLDRLTKEISENISTEEATNILADLLMHHGISDFFALTTSLLNEKTALSPTREVVETKATHLGQ